MKSKLNLFLFILLNISILMLLQFMNFILLLCQKKKLLPLVADHFKYIEVG